MADEEKKEPPSPHPLETGRDRLRETLKWLIASFGAIAASLTLGTQLGNLGDLEGWRLVLALVAATLAFAGVIAALGIAVHVLVGSYVNFGQLGSPGSRDELVKFFEQQNPQYLGNYGTLAKMREAYLQAFREGSDKRQELATLVSQLINVASYERLRRRFARGLVWILLSVSIAGAAIIAFAWAATVDKKDDPATPAAAVAAIPSPVNVSLTPAAATQLKEELGPACNRRQLPALALSSNTGKVEVVTLPSEDCRITRFIHEASMGTITPAQPACTVKQEVVLCNDIAP